MERPIIMRALGLCLAALVAYLIIPREPSYQGKGCRVWLAELDGAAITGDARRAFQLMGASTLPYLISELEAKDPRWKTGLVDLAGKQSLFKFHFVPDSLRRERAVKACVLLGPTARPAILALGVALANGASGAANVLQKFGSESIPVLANALTNAPGCAPPYNTARVLGSLGADARIAVTNLAWNFQHHRIGFPRAAAAIALAEISLKLIEKEDQRASPEVLFAKAALIRGLAERDRTSCIAAAQALGLLGSYAEEAVPVLLMLLDAPDPAIRNAAAEALKAIAPTTASLREA
jgi:hypothetical protein